MWRFSALCCYFIICIINYIVGPKSMVSPNKLFLLFNRLYLSTYLAYKHEWAQRNQPWHVCAFKIPRKFSIWNKFRNMFLKTLKTIHYLLLQTLKATQFELNNRCSIKPSDQQKVNIVMLLSLYFILIAKKEWSFYIPSIESQAFKEIV